jgi:hypothetical protein
LVLVPLWRSLAALRLIGRLCATRPITGEERKSILEDWKTIRFGVIEDRGDVGGRGQTIILQRADSGHQAAVSVSGPNRRIPSNLGMPELVGITSDVYATKLIEHQSTWTER